MSWNTWTRWNILESLPGPPVTRLKEGAEWGREHSLLWRPGSLCEVRLRLTERLPDCNEYK